jgi:hypothetical protein
MLPVKIEDIRHQPYIHLCGPAKLPNKADATFEIDAPQYVSALKNIPRENMTFPAHILIPDSPRYKKGKPIPTVNTYVAVAGFLSHIAMPSFEATNSDVDRFCVTLDNISFLGKKMHMPIECKPSSTVQCPPKLTILYSSNYPDTSG